MAKASLKTIDNNIFHIDRTQDGDYIVDCEKVELKVFDDSGLIKWQYLMYNPGKIDEIKASQNGEFWVAQDGHWAKFTKDSSQYLELIPITPPANVAEAEKEVIPFMLHYIQRDINSLGDILSNDKELAGRLGLTPPAENLIIYYPVKDTINKDPNSQKPSAVWLTNGNQLVPKEDKSKAIKKYENGVNLRSITPWGYGIYEFGIISIENNNQLVKMYLNYSCGGLCGHGTELILQRRPSGKWWVVDLKGTWIS